MTHRPVVLLAIATLLGARLAAAATVDVQIVGMSFSPAAVSIQVGDTVRWTNSTGTFHDVKADDNSFGNTVSPSWTFTHTFDTPGNFGYHCSVHGFPGGGMAGTVQVGGTASNAGTLRLSQASYVAAEPAGTASITVQRMDGDDGAVSVQFAATAGSATAGADFTPTSGTLSWADGDDSSKSFAVTLLNDAVVEPTETVSLELSNPTGGTTIDPTRRTATLSITDDDVPTGNPPAAPSNLQAAALSTSEVSLTWTDNATNESGFRIERRTVDGAFAEVQSTGANATSAVVPGLTPSTFYLFRVRAAGSGSFSAYSNQASATTLGQVAPCIAGAQTLCVNNGRFRAEIAFHTADAGGRGQAVTVPTAPDSGLFYFFGPGNIEMLVKVLNACVFDRFWVFYSATTNVEFAVTVTDTQTGKVKSYFNPLNNPAPPVQDTDAFATCP